MRTIAIVLSLLGFAPSVTLSQEASIKTLSCDVREDRKGNSDECPCKVGWRPRADEIEGILSRHQEWLLGYRIDFFDFDGLKGRPVLCNVDLQNKNLEGANLSFANLAGANLVDANLAGAELDHASLKDVKLHRTDLTGATLDGTDLTGTKLENTDLNGATLSNVTLDGAEYAPDPAHPPDYDVAGIEGIETVTFPPGKQSGLVVLRRVFKQQGLRRLEREATFAIERNKASHDRNDQLLSRQIEGWFSLVFFGWTTGWGLNPERPFLIGLVVAIVAAIFYGYALRRSRIDHGKGAGIYRVWPSGSMKLSSEGMSIIESSQSEPIEPTNFWKIIAWASYFSILSAFRIGWRDLNLGIWISRLQPTEFSLRGNGWVRVVSGLQSLISVYLVAMWMLTRFARPFD